MDYAAPMNSTLKLGSPNLTCGRGAENPRRESFLVLLVGGAEGGDDESGSDAEGTEKDREQKKSRSVIPAAEKTTSGEHYPQRASATR